MLQPGSNLWKDVSFSTHLYLGWHNKPLYLHCHTVFITYYVETTHIWKMSWNTAQTWYPKDDEWHKWKWHIFFELVWLVALFPFLLKPQWRGLTWSVTLIMTLCPSLSPQWRVTVSILTCPGRTAPPPTQPREAFALTKWLEKCRLELFEILITFSHQRLEYIVSFTYLYTGLPSIEISISCVNCKCNISCYVLTSSANWINIPFKPLRVLAIENICFHPTVSNLSKARAEILPPHC